MKSITKCIWQSLIIFGLTLTLAQIALAWDEDPQNTLSPDLVDDEVRKIIDDIQTYHTSQVDRAAYIESIKISDQLLDGLLIQWHYLNENFSSGNMLRILADQKMVRSLYIKDHQVRLMGAIYSILNPGNSSDLQHFNPPSDITNLNVSLEKYSQRIVDCLVEMQTYMEERLYSYEHLTTGGRTDRERYTDHIPTFWTIIVYTLNQYGVLSPTHIENLGVISKKMLIAHGEAFAGIVTFKQLLRPTGLSGKNIAQDKKIIANYYETELYQFAERKYNERVQSLWKIDFNKLNIYGDLVSYRNPTMAKEMNAPIAAVGHLFSRRFLEDHSDTIDITKLLQQLQYEPNLHSDTVATATSLDVDTVQRLMDFF